MLNRIRLSTFFLLPSFLTFFCGCGPVGDKQQSAEDTHLSKETDNVELMSDSTVLMPAAWSTQGWSQVMQSVDP